MQAENSLMAEKTGTYFNKHRLNVGISIIGMLIIIYGTLLTDLAQQESCYLSGGILMLISAALERQTFFVILQSIISVGALVAFTSFTPMIKAAIPLGLSVIAIIYLVNQQLLNDKLSITGCIGLISIAAGYAIAHPVVYLVGAIVLTIYSFGAYQQRGSTIGLLWGILNTVFSVTTSIDVYRLFF